MNPIIQFFSDHFEIISTLNAIVLSCAVIVILMSWTRLLRLEHFLKAVNRTMFFFVFVGEAVLLFMLCLVFIDNYHPQNPLDLSAHVQGDTAWVEDRLTIYYIEDNELISISAQGKGRRVVYRADTPVLSYRFSPDGNLLLVTTGRKLELLDLDTVSKLTVDHIGAIGPGQDAVVKGAFDGVRFSPDGDKFCYRKAAWTRFSSIENWKVYDVVNKKHQVIRNPTRLMNALIWGRQGDRLFYSWFEALDTTRHGNPYRIKIYEIPLSDPTPRLATEFLFDQPTAPEDYLSSIREVPIYAADRQLSFGKARDISYSMTSAQGARIGIDDEDHLYFIKNKWWSRRLYRIPRIGQDPELAHEYPQGGRLAVRYLRWLPSGRYVIMEHDFFGVLILDPVTRKVGILVTEKGDTFGWSPALN